MTILTGTSAIARGLAGGDVFGTGPAGPRHAALVSDLTDTSSEQAINLLSISDSDMTKLLRILEPLPSREFAARIAGLFNSAVAAAAVGDVRRASSHLAALAALDPRRVETLASEPALALIRSEVIRVVATLTFAARGDAEARLEHARQVLQTVQLQTRESRAIQPEAALVFAERLIEAGSYAGFVHSLELSQLVLNYGRHLQPCIEAQVPRSSKSELPATRLLWILVALVALLLLIFGRTW